MLSPARSEADEDLAAQGQRAVLELLLRTLEVAEAIMLTGGSGDAPRIAACRYVYDLSLKGPFARAEQADATGDALEASRLATAAQEAIAEVLGIGADGADGVDETDAR